jgi:16S rRNA (guanine527-N7)-methyltransferase
MKDFSEKYLNYLKGPLAGLNLTKITDADEFYNKQIYDSVAPFEKSNQFQNAINFTKRVVDVGFGGGFPILPLAHHLPEIKFLGIEARKKKAIAVDQIREHLSIGNAKLLHQRLETINFDVPTVVTLKAVGKVEDMLGMMTCSTAEVYVFFYKGPNFFELENLKNVKKSWELIENIEISIPGTVGRLLVGFKKKNVPRGTKFNKKLVNLSGLF